MSANPGIRELVGRLSWNNSESEISMAAHELENLVGDEIKLLIQDNLDKSTWINSAKVLKTIGFPRLLPFTPSLLEWFQDMNWPGIEVVAAIFAGGDGKMLLPFIEDAAKKAILQNDDCWIRGLNYLLKEMRVPTSEFSDPETASILDQVERNG